MDRSQNALQRSLARLIPQFELVSEVKLVAVAVVDDLSFGEVGIGDGNECSVERPDTG